MQMTSEIKPKWGNKEKKTEFSQPLEEASQKKTNRRVMTYYDGGGETTRSNPESAMLFEADES